MTTKYKLLPSKSSELIRLALKDLEKIENDPKATVNMGKWWAKCHNEEKCSCCLAGAVMREELGFPGGYEERFYIVPSHYWSDGTYHSIQDKLYALDAFRRGMVHAGLAWMGEREYDDPDSMFPNRSITMYQKNRDRFFADMEALAADLEKAGL